MMEAAGIEPAQGSPGLALERLARLCEEWPGPYAYPAEVVADIRLVLDTLGSEFHVFESRKSGGWALEHPLRCRVDGLLNCEVHRAASGLDEPPVPPGRYRAEVESGELVLHDDLVAEASPEPAE